jgi:hypothetical protein
VSATRAAFQNTIQDHLTASFIESTTVEKTLVGRVLFNVGGLAFLGSIGMMFVLGQIAF